jgi:succinate-acetate transporter protein
MVDWSTNPRRSYMEAGRIGPREADVAPAPAATEPTAGRAAGWTPADPGPLGLAGFAMTTFVLSMYNANLIAAGGTLVVLSLALAYGGLAQLLAGMWEFRTGNTFGAVAFSSFGAFWISYYLLVKAVLVPGLIAAPAVHNAVAVYLYAWAIFTTYMFVASLRTTGAVALVFLLLAATFWILGIGNASLAGTRNLTNGTIKLGGWVGLVTAGVAWYASFAAVVNSTFGRVVAPVFPLRRAA